MTDDPLNRPPVAGTKSRTEESINSFKRVRDRGSNRSVSFIDVDGTPRSEYRVGATWAPDRDRFTPDATGQAAYLAACYSIGHRRAASVGRECAVAGERLADAEKNITTFHSPETTLRPASEGIETAIYDLPHLIGTLEKVHRHFTAVVRERAVTIPAIRGELEENAPRTKWGAPAGIEVIGEGGL